MSAFPPATTVFMAPETAMQPQCRALFSMEPLKHRLAMVSVDEAHCILEWLVYNELIAP